MVVSSSTGTCWCSSHSTRSWKFLHESSSNSSRQPDKHDKKNKREYKMHNEGKHVHWKQQTNKNKCLVWRWRWRRRRRRGRCERGKNLPHPLAYSARILLRLLTTIPLQLKQQHSSSDSISFCIYLTLSFPAATFQSVWRVQNSLLI